MGRSSLWFGPERFRSIDASEGVMGSVRGRCLCGGVRFEIRGPLDNPLNCHCENCRKQHGAAFRTRVRVEKDDFHWVEGEHLVSFYESSAGVFRGFCRICGSPILNKFAGGEAALPHNSNASTRYGIPVGILDGDPGVRAACHVFVRSKAVWFEITDELPQYQGLPQRK
ncbi:MAG: GFA family protein [Hyphomicrobiaceae bacterium]|nr:GFA family protein [Hyphomicrobiaceae bacterium]